MNKNYKLIKQSHDKTLNVKYYLFKCKPQKRTIICLNAKDNTDVIHHINLNEHCFLLVTSNEMLARAYMGEFVPNNDMPMGAYVRQTEISNDDIVVRAYNFNGNIHAIHCGLPNYMNLPFEPKNFTEFLSKFWQSKFLSYNDRHSPNYCSYWPDDIKQHEIPIKEENK